MAKSQNKLFCFGFGYTARHLAAALAADGWSIAGTCRRPDRQRALRAAGIEARLFDHGHALEGAAAALAGCTHLLVSVPPDADGDLVLRSHASDIAALDGLRWAGYLSTTGVYGDRDGGWVDEETELRPSGERGRRRCAAEAGWLELWRDHGVPVHIFRLAGIYGPGRSALDQVRNGTARRIVKPGHAFSRIHVDDIAATLQASMARPRPGAIYNVCDDASAPSSDVVDYACTLLEVDPPPATPFEDAALSPMAAGFYADNKRVRNTLIKTELGVELGYPDYRSGLTALLRGQG
jgi:nucleoside-diphosphate-sugar epimerase